MKLTDQEERALYVGLVRDYLKSTTAEFRAKMNMPPDVMKAHEHAIYIITKLNGTYTPPVYSEDEQ